MSAIDFLTDLSAKLREQDNAYTASPIYCIQEHKGIYGIDEDYGGKIGWFNEDGGSQADGRKEKALERYYDRYGKEPEGWTRCGYEHRWQYTGLSFLTHAAAHGYVANNKHRHEDEIRVYVDSAWRNYEMKEVRRLLAGPVAECIATLSAVANYDMADNGHVGMFDNDALWARMRAALASLETAKEPHQ